MILLQHASGDCVPLLEFAAPIHAADCARNGSEYRATYGALQRERTPHWDKIVLIKKTLAIAPEGELIAWLDADCLKINAAPFSLPDGYDLGMVQNARLQFNTGVIVIRNTQESRDFFEHVWNDGPRQYWQMRLHEQCVVNLFRKDIEIAELDPAWNFWPNVCGQPRGVVRVMAWHSAMKPDALLGMRAAAKRIIAPKPCS